MFQLGLFLRVLRPARTVLCPARFTQRPARIKFLFIYFLLQNVIALFVFSDAVKMLVKCLQICAPCCRRSPTKLYPDLVSFACWIVTEFWSFMRKSVPDLVIRALNCARFCVVYALNCAQILVVRTLDSAQFLLHPTLFQTLPSPSPRPSLGLGLGQAGTLQAEGNSVFFYCCH